MISHLFLLPLLFAVKLSAVCARWPKH